MPESTEYGIYNTKCRARKNVHGISPIESIVMKDNSIRIERIWTEIHSSSYTWLFIETMKKLDDSLKVIRSIEECAD